MQSVKYSVMGRFLVLIVLLTGLMGGAVYANSTPPDSLGIKVIDGKTFIMHRVDPGETLYALSRRYKVSVEQIMGANRMQTAALNVDQVVRIPVEKGSSALSLKDYGRTTEQDNTVDNVTTGKKKMHTVSAGETLYGISKAYGVSVESIQNWNNLSSNSLSIGQELIVGQAGGQTVVTNEEEEQTVQVTKVEIQDDEEEETVVSTVDMDNEEKNRGKHVVKAGETLYSISKKYGMLLKDIRDINNLADPDVQEGDVLIVWVKEESDIGSGDSQPVTEMEEESEEVVVNQEEESQEEVTESNNEDEVQESLENTNDPIDGNASKIIPVNAEKKRHYDRKSNKDFWQVSEHGTAGTLQKHKRGFYGAHKTLPLGSVIRVELPRLKQAITVEIVERLPDSDPNIILLTKKARMYLLHEDEAEEITIRYMVPVGE